ncbi:MAG: DUF2384 domain-containing protein [Burkholderiales bacterium]|nr:DUF2384 domain-containing protein [Burkholderiales bacterium]
MDGYNFYYGCLKGTPYKWLDLLQLFERHVLPTIYSERNGQPVCAQLEPLALKFFTAKIRAAAAKGDDSVSSQARYHTALRKLYGGRVELIEGYYSMQQMKVKIVDAEDPGRPPRDCQEIQAWKLEEKQSDVNLALHAYHDAMTGAVEQVVFVTNDTDIATALEMIRTHTEVQVGLVVPTSDHQRIPNADLAKHAHWVRTHVTKEELAASQLPRVIPGRKPTVKPESWYAQSALLKQVLDLAIPIRGSRTDAFKWLDEPNPYLGDVAPMALLETEEGAAQVLAYIHGWIAEQAAKNGP